MAAVMVFGTWIGGSLVDLPWAKSRKTHAMAAYVLIAAVNSTTWIWSVIIQNRFRRKDPVVDWSDQSTFAPWFGVYMFQFLSPGILKNYTYWCISNLSNSPGQQVRYSSLLRGIETAAVVVGFRVQAVPTELIITAGLKLAWWFIALPFGFYATLQVVHKFDWLQVELQVERETKIRDRVTADEEKS